MKHKKIAKQALASMIDRLIPWDATILEFAPEGTKGADLEKIKKHFIEVTATLTERLRK